MGHPVHSKRLNSISNTIINILPRVILENVCHSHARQLRPAQLCLGREKMLHDTTCVKIVCISFDWLSNVHWLDMGTRRPWNGQQKNYRSLIHPIIYILISRKGCGGKSSWETRISGLVMNLALEIIFRSFYYYRIQATVLLIKKIHSNNFINKKCRKY